MKSVYFSFLLTLSLQFVAIIVTKAQIAHPYYTNRAIAGQSEDAQGVNYLLLHEAYTTTALDDHHVMGKISAIRGNDTRSNRKWTVEVNTSSAYLTTRGSIISYNEPAYLVTLTYNGVRYLAVTINNNAMLFYFSFTGYAQGETLQLVHDENVTDVQTFTSLDPVTIQGSVAIGGTTTGAHKLTVEGSIGARRVKVTAGPGWPDFVFAPEYRLPALGELENYVKANRHLPEVPTAAELEKDGVDLGEMNKQLLKKVEELTLYIIQQQKTIGELDARVKMLEKTDDGF
ncbi:hypothetical protein F0L74_07720 [Chitinophaga agrisoli]|uniref:Uncharacterized protein n=1 Tax=Chitinophaga agrisoli TaxID=2607653 RepID=A0A5B2VTR9_9BACT|nr:hypothetical protein [Chitinophaga agrisoli]KAA2242425.1 hypothetical protein F0L74_07720 [Chitinophaga agrisoli]